MKKIIFVGVFFLLLILSYFLLSYEKEMKFKEHLEVQTEQYVKSYNALYHEFKTRADLLYTTRINTKEVVEIFKDATLGSEDKKNESRVRLYNHLKDTYSFFKDYKVKQLHFHTVDNESFLRFHRPKRYGDNLTDIRATVKYVNENKKPIDGFEEGRIYNGYRFVFPMFYEKKHIGSVEISFDTLAITLEFIEHYDVIADFLILKSVIDKKVFKNERSNYIDSPVENFCYEKQIHEHIEPPSKETLGIINKRVQNKESFSIYDRVNKDIMTFIKVQNPISEKVVGIFVVRSSAYYILNKTTNFYMALALIDFFIMLVMFIMYKEMTYRGKVENSNKNLGYIIKEKTKEQSLLLSLFDKGDTVLFKWNNDENWSIDYVSSSVYALTGYSKDDFFQENLNYSSIIYKSDLDKVGDEVSKALETNLEFFKHEPYRIVTQDGTLKWVLDYTTVVMDDDNNVTHFIGAISDITEIKEQEKLLLEQSRLAQMGEMISMIAHQWRQPLSTISASTINMQMGIDLGELNLNAKDEKYLISNMDMINTCVQNLSTTIDDFRNFYKPNKKSSKGSTRRGDFKIIKNY